MKTEFILFPGYEISYRPLNGTLINTIVLEDPECLRMTVDELLDEFGEVSIRKKGEQMIKVYFGNNETKKYIGESNTDSGAFRIIEDYVKNVIGWQKVYYRFWNEDGALVVDFGNHRNFFYVEH